MSWKPEVIADNSGQWTGNALRFATEVEAKEYALDLACRWMAVREWRAVEDDHQPNYRWVHGHIEPITAEERERAIYDAKPELLE